MAPTFPVAPVLPVAPKPVAPVAPMPVAPVLPCSPTPVAPVLPIPVEPVAPCSPIPVAPVLPIPDAPVAPTKPVLPVAPEPVAPVIKQSGGALPSQRKVYTGAVGAPMPPRIISNIHTSPMSVDNNNMPHINAVAVKSISIGIKTESNMMSQQREKQKAIKAQFAIPNLGNIITNNDGFDLPFKKKVKTKKTPQSAS